jgi:hypothetical protein
LPSGLDINSDGLISGSAISAGAFNFTAEVSDSLNRSARQAYLLKVIAPPRITEVRYKAKKRKLTIMGELFDEMAIILVDGKEVSPNSKDNVSIAIKKLSLDRGRHEVRIVNPDGGTAAIEITVT